MRELLDSLVRPIGRARFPDRGLQRLAARRIASVLGGVAHLRQTEFGGRRP
jgi:hypothetical protein